MHYSQLQKQPITLWAAACFRPCAGSVTVQRERILIVDDNELNSKLIKALLVKEGYSVESAGTAAETRQLLAAFHPRLILMDIQLPDANGIELAQELKAAGNVIIVALTAYTAPDNAERARAAGCDGYITKPVDARTLPALLRRYLDASA